MVTVSFIVNSETKTTQLKPGQKVVTGAFKLGLDAQGIGECGGNCVCTTCHVYVHDGMDHFGNAHAREMLLLDQLPHVQPNSRLACQMIVPKNLSADTTIVVEVV